MTMRLPILCAVAVLFVLTPAAVGAEELTGSADVVLDSSYVWRGQVLNDEPVLQPSLTFEQEAWSLTVWANLDLTDRNLAAGELGEVDLDLSSTFSVAGVPLTLGTIEYLFPGSSGANTGEVYASIAPDVVLEPALTISYDWDQIEGFYAELSLGHAFALSERTTLDLRAASGWASSDFSGGYFGVDHAGACDGRLAASLEVAVSPELALSAAARYTWFWGSDLGDAAAATYGEQRLLAATLGLSYAF
jgi:hypothetical protein